jgi:hypothetical protein
MRLEDVHMARSALTGRVYIGTVRQVEGGLLEWRSKVDRTDEFDEVAKEERTEARAECLREVRKMVNVHRFRTIHACKPLDVVGADALLLALEKLEGGGK